MPLLLCLFFSENMGHPQPIEMVIIKMGLNYREFTVWFVEGNFKLAITFTNLRFNQ